MSDKARQELPFGIVRPPSVANTKSAVVDIDDHLGKSSVMVDTWWNGEGMTLRVCESDQPDVALDVSFTQWVALKLAVKAVLEKDGTTL